MDVMNYEIINSSDHKDFALLSAAVAWPQRLCLPLAHRFDRHSPFVSFNWKLVGLHCQYRAGNREQNLLGYAAHNEFTHSGAFSQSDHKHRDLKRVDQCFNF